jgi:ribosomal protein L16 Arg81 hydroxylase
MTVQQWQNDPLAYLLGNLSEASFFRDYYEQQALICAHSDASRFSDLLSLARLDDLLANSELPPKALDMARKQPPIKRSYYTYSNGNIDRGAVLHHYRNGASIILPSLHLADSRLADFCRALEAIFSCRVQTNIYLTPPNSQGFNTHYDDHDVFVMQISGCKRWRLYERPVDKPYRGEKFKAAEHRPGHPKEDFLLQAGDVVYVPRGLMHDASAEGDSPSLHITVGLLGQSWADLLLESLSEWALRDAACRQSLPPGFHHQDFDKQQARQHFQALISRFQEQAEFDEAFELMRETMLRNRRPALTGALLAASSTENEADYRLRPGLQTLLRADDKEVVLVCAGGNIHFPAEALPGLQTVLAAEAFGPELFAELGEEVCRDIIGKLNDFGIVERIDRDKH